MADKSKIEWTDATWNPVTGCSKVSPGCKNCYAEREWPRMTKLVPAYAGRKFTDVQCHPERLWKNSPATWKKPRKVFVNSMSDLFHPDVPFSFIDEVFEVINCSPEHIFQILTKRPHRMQEYFDTPNGMQWEAMENVWLGVSVENQTTADERIPLLLSIPAVVRFLSVEPMLGSINIDPIFMEHYGNGARTDSGIGWVICGGESGPNARPMHPDWVRSLRDQCAAVGVPFLFKQWGEWSPGNVLVPRGTEAVTVERSGVFHPWPPAFDPDGGNWCMHKVGKKAAGRLLDGVEHNGYPEVLP